MESTEHFGTIGGFLKDESGQKFAMTNDHVTRHASSFFVKSLAGRNDESDRIYFGKSVDPHTQSEGAANIKETHTPDIDVVAVGKGLSRHCCNDFVDQMGRRRRTRIYNDSIHKLYGRRVYKCLPRDSTEQVKYGRMSSTETHLKINDKIGGMKDIIIVEGEHAAFAKEGESGTIIAVDTNGDALDLVGMIYGGINHTDKPYKLTLCLGLKKGISFLKRKYGQELKLDTRRSYDLRLSIECGSKIYFDIEKPLSVDFELHDYILTLTCNNVIDSEQGDIEWLKQNEEHLSCLVNDRNDLVTVESGSVEQTMLYHSMKACESLYSEDYTATERHLKIASRSLLRLSEFQFRLLCKLISYASWFYLEKEDFATMKKLLDGGLEYMLEHKNYASFSKESLGYHYYDFSRYYQKVSDFPNAERCAKAAMDLFTELDTLSHTKDTANRLMLAVCQYACVKLKCGENFDLINLPVAADEVSEAELYLSKMESKLEVVSVVQGLDYRLTVCDLYFRKAEYVKALTVCNQCLEISNTNNMQKENQWATIRKKKIQCLLRDRKHE